MSNIDDINRDAGMTGSTINDQSGVRDANSPSPQNLHPVDDTPAITARRGTQPIPEDTVPTANSGQSNLPPMSNPQPSESTEPRTYAEEEAARESAYRSGYRSEEREQHRDAHDEVAAEREAERDEAREAGREDAAADADAQEV